jgi:hypothetical protein
MSETASTHERVPSARAGKPQEQQQHTEQTYFFAIEDTYELGIAKAWFKTTYPNSKAKLTNQLPLNRLTQHAVVIPVIRGEDRSAATDQERFQNGSSRVIHRKPQELVHEVRECRPVAIADFWVARADEFDAFGGELDRGKFMEALAKSAAPCTSKTHIGTPDTLKLGFI